MIRRERLLLHLAVDIAILTVREDQLHVLAIERANEPYRSATALPGGFLRAGEDLHEAAERELAEETGLDGGALHLEQLATYGSPDRDPRARVVSVAYLALAPDLPIPTAGSDARVTEIYGLVQAFEAEHGPVQVTSANAAVAETTGVVDPAGTIPTPTAAPIPTPSAAPPAASAGPLPQAQYGTGES